MVAVERVAARLVVLSCGHTAWVHPEHTLGGFARCTACPPLTIDYGPGTTPQRQWSVVFMAVFDVPAIIEWAD